jgi:hypothetical protein
LPPLERVDVGAKEKEMLALLITGLLCASPQGLSDTDCKKLHDSLKPPAAELWRDIPWKVSLVEAQNLAAREKKALFIWSMDGNPLGCG